MISTEPKVQELIRMLDEAVSIEDECARCHRGKDVPNDIVAGGGKLIPEEFSPLERSVPQIIISLEVRLQIRNRQRHANFIIL